MIIWNLQLSITPNRSGNIQIYIHNQYRYHSMMISSLNNKNLDHTSIIIYIHHSYFIDHNSQNIQLSITSTIILKRTGSLYPSRGKSPWASSLYSAPSLWAYVWKTEVSLATEAGWSINCCWIYRQLWAVLLLEVAEALT